MSALPSVSTSNSSSTHYANAETNVGAFILTAIIFFVVAVLVYRAYTSPKMRNVPLFHESQGSLWQPGRVWLSLEVLTTLRVMALIYFTFFLFQSYVLYGFFHCSLYFTYWSLTMLCSYFACVLLVTYRGLKQDVTVLGWPEQWVILSFENCLVSAVLVDVIYWTLLTPDEVVLPEDLPTISYHGLNLPVIYLEAFLNSRLTLYPVHTKRACIYLGYVLMYTIWAWIRFFAGWEDYLPYGFMYFIDFSALLWYAGLCAVQLGTFHLVQYLVALCKRPKGSFASNPCAPICGCCPLCSISFQTTSPLNMNTALAMTLPAEFKADIKSITNTGELVQSPPVVQSETDEAGGNAPAPMMIEDIGSNLNGNEQGE